MKLRFVIALALAAGISLAANAASKVRLVYGGDWSPIGRQVKKTMVGPAFVKAAAGRYQPEFIEENDLRLKAADANLGSLKLPCIFLISEEGRCYYVWDSVAGDITAEKMVERFERVDKIRQAAEKAGMDTADKCGELLQKMERYVGGPRRVIAKGFYEDVFKKLQELDPKDETGWQRRFMLGAEFDPKYTKADGLELVIKANWYREQAFGGIPRDWMKNLPQAEREQQWKANQAKMKVEGAAFVEAEMKKPIRHLSKEQIQGVLMAKFAFYRDDQSKTEELNTLLRRIAKSDETTFWGTAALGWLNMRGAPELSLYWGWHDKDFVGAKFVKTISYGVGHRFSDPGKYTIRFVTQKGGSVKVGSVELKAGDEVVATLKKPTQMANVSVFEYELPKKYSGKLTAMIVRGDAPEDGISAGAIEVRRNLLRPRKEVGKEAK